MTFVRSFVLAAALAASAAPRASAMVPAKVAPPVQIAVVNLGELSPELLRAAWTQTAAVLDRLGSDLRVRSSAPGDLVGPGDITVILMPGRPGPQLRATVLGAVQPAGAPRVLWLFPEVVAGALGLPDASSARSAEDEAALGVGLGRVTAHELVHLLCPWRPHDRTGLMAARMSAAILRGGPFEIDDALRRDFRLGAGFARSRIADAGSPPIL